MSNFGLNTIDFYAKNLKYVDKFTSLPFICKISKAILFNGLLNVIGDEFIKFIINNVVISIKKAGKWLSKKFLIYLKFDIHDNGNKYGVTFQDLKKYLQLSLKCKYSFTKGSKFTYFGKIPVYVRKTRENQDNIMRIVFLKWHEQEMMDLLKKSINPKYWSEEHLKSVQRFSYFSLYRRPYNSFKGKRVGVSDIYFNKKYEDVELEIRSYFDIFNEIKINISPLVIFYKGKPGAGKTMFLEYLTKMNLQYYAIKMDTNYLKEDKKKEGTIFNEFSEFISRFNCEDNLVVMIDEIDKFYQSMENKMLLEKEKDANTVVKQETKKELRHAFKGQFLDDLFQFINNPELGKIAIIFCVNSTEIFNSIENRHKPLVDRIIFKKLDLYKYEEVCGYLRFYNEKLKNSKLYASNLDIYFEKMNKDIVISARKLTQILTHTRFNMSKIIEEINNITQNNYQTY